MATFFHQFCENLCGQLQLREQLSRIVHVHRLRRWFSRSLVSKMLLVTILYPEKLNLRWCEKFGRRSNCIPAFVSLAPEQPTLKRSLHPFGLR